jgi:Tfp pilus assembly protein PilF
VAEQNVKARIHLPGLAVALVLSVITITAFWPVSGYDFVNYDDNLYVTENTVVQQGFTWSGVVWAFSANHAYNWHPLTWISHMVDCQLFGLWAPGHHLTSLFLHVLNSVLLFLLLWRMTDSVWRSGMVAALFALHPLHVESVAWVSERKDVLSTLFWIVATWAYVRYTEAPGFFRYACVFLLLAAGLMTKPMLVTLPFVFLLLDYWPLDRLGEPLQRSGAAEHRKQHVVSSMIRLVREKVPLFALSILSSGVTFLVQQQEGAVRSLESIPVDVRLSNVLVSYVAYIGKMIWPINLAVLYPYPISIPLWKAATAGGFLITLSGLVIRYRRRHRYLLTGWLWYLGTLVPVIGLVQVGVHSMADRYTYIPLIGLFILVAWGGEEVFRKWQWGQVTSFAVALGVILVLAFVSRLQLNHWKNSVVLFENAIDVTSGNYIAHLNLGAARYARGEMDRAISEYRKALDINANHAAIHDSLGAVLLVKGRYGEAIPHFSRALEIDPNLVEAKKNLKTALKHMGWPDDEAEALNRRAISLAARGEFQEAADALSEALQIRPRFAEAHYNLGKVLAAQGKVEEAIFHYSEALRINSNYVEAHNNLGIALAEKGDLEKARDHFAAALRANPDFVEARKNLERADKAFSKKR